jgi:hypothetical protein
MEGMLSRDNFFQLAHARARQVRLPAAASNSVVFRIGIEKSTMAGAKTIARKRSVVVVV